LLGGLAAEAGAATGGFGARFTRRTDRAPGDHPDR
jgi:hypothetical protein